MKKFKVYLFIIFVISLAGCAEKQMDEEKAKSVAEAHINAANKEDFSALEELYASDFLASEPMKQKEKKLRQLREVMGEVKGKKFLRLTHISEFGQPQQVEVLYEVEHTNIKSIEIFRIIEDEGGYKISSYSVESTN
jgi:hypothetical protein